MEEISFYYPNRRRRLKGRLLRLYKAGAATMSVLNVGRNNGRQTSQIVREMIAEEEARKCFQQAQDEWNARKEIARIEREDEPSDAGEYSFGEVNLGHVFADGLTIRGRQPYHALAA